MTVRHDWVKLTGVGWGLRREIIGCMTGGRIKVDCLAETLDGPLVRFAAGAAGVAVLRDAFDQLAGCEPVVAIEGMEVAGLSSIEFRQGIRGGCVRWLPGGWSSTATALNGRRGLA